MEYNYVFEKVSQKAHFFIVKKFKEFYNEDWTFEYSIDSIRKYLSDHNNKSIIFRNHELFKTAISKFKYRKDYFRTGDGLTKIINTQITKEFNDKIKIKIIEDSNFEELKKYSFEKFIFDLIIYDTLEKIENRLAKNSTLYRLFFEINNYKEFTLEHFEGKVEDSELYKKLYEIANPETKSVKQATKVEDTISDIDPRFTLLNKKEEEILKFNISKFSEDEKIFLLHVLYYSKIKFPIPEYSKLILIANGITDLSIFTKGTINNRFYDKLFQGIEYYGDTEKREFINRVILKIEPFNMKNINKAINIIKTKIT